jgi:hypothetical protein
MLASLAAPFVYKLLKPAVQGLIQQHRAAAATPSSPPAAEQGGGGGAGPDDGPIDWEELFAKSQRFGSDPAQRAAAAAAAAAAARDVDWSCPRSVLGIAPHAQLSAGRLQRAFRRELMLHHPDHQGPPGVGSSSASSSSSAGDSGGELVALSHHSTDSTEDMD